MPLKVNILSSGSGVITIWRFTRFARGAPVESVSPQPPAAFGAVGQGGAKRCTARPLEVATQTRPFRSTATLLAVPRAVASLQKFVLRASVPGKAPGGPGKRSKGGNQTIS